MGIDHSTREASVSQTLTLRCLFVLAYTYYAFFEWSLIVSDLAFDAVALLDFDTFELRVVDVGLGGKHDGAFNDLKTYGGNESSIKPFEIVSFVADVYLGKNLSIGIYYDAFREPCSNLATP